MVLPQSDDAATINNTADVCAGKLPLVSMGGRAEGLACADPGVRTPIGGSRNFSSFLGTVFQNLRRVCRMVSNFCIGS